MNKKPRSKPGRPLGSHNYDIKNKKLLEKKQRTGHVTGMAWDCPNTPEID